MLIVSRAVRTLLKKHSWQNPSQYSFGLLLGIRETLFAALPVGHVPHWDALDIDFLDSEIWPRAFRLAAQTHLSLVGTYATFPESDDGENPSPWRSPGIYIEHQMVCCSACSHTAYFKNQQRLTIGSSVILSSGPSLLPSLNQKRILKDWNQLLGRKSYKDQFQSSTTI